MKKLTFYKVSSTDESERVYLPSEIRLRGLRLSVKLDETARFTGEGVDDHRPV